MKKILLTGCVFVLSGCFATGGAFPDFKGPSSWTKAQKISGLQEADVDALDSWWTRFEEPELNALIDKALADNPDRRIARARILEARGMARSARSSLFPQIGGSASRGREDGAVGDATDVFDARFDASYEIDIFGKNRKNYSAAEEAVKGLEANYENVTLSLIAEVVRTYIDMRAAQKQVVIAGKNLEAQEETLKLIKVLSDAGESPRLDVERAESLVNSTRASIPEFERIAENTRLRLAVLAGALPEDIDFESQSIEIPGGDVAPVLMTPAAIMALRPDIRAAAANLRARTDLAESATAEIFPSFTVSGFYGVAENAFASSSNIWGIAIGTAVALLDWGRIEGQIDAARARETEAYELYRKTVLEAVNDVETALNDFAHINEQAVSLDKAYKNAEQAFKLSQQLFTEGEISFLDVLDSQRTLNDAESALVNAEGQKSQALVRIYKSLGVSFSKPVQDEQATAPKPRTLN